LTFIHILVYTNICMKVGLIRCLLIVLFALGCKIHAPTVERVDAETVILLHGMGRTRAAMYLMACRFEHAGYSVYNFPYDDKNKTLDELSTELLVFIEKNVTTPRYHLVGHSLGNIVIRNAFRQKFSVGLGRIVMLAPPNQPALLAKVLKNNFIYKWRTGDSGQKLANDEFYRTLPIPTAEFGIIAGNKGQNLTFSEDNDGIITVESSKLQGSQDWVEVNHSHTFIMNAKDTFRLCHHFIKFGSFQ